MIMAEPTNEPKRMRIKLPDDYDLDAIKRHTTMSAYASKAIREKLHAGLGKEQIAEMNAKHTLYCVFNFEGVTVEQLLNRALLSQSITVAMQNGWMRTLVSDDDDEANDKAIVELCAKHSPANRYEIRVANWINPKAKASTKDPQAEINKQLPKLSTDQIDDLIKRLEAQRKQNG
jgi:hypothetical protein